MARLEGDEGATQYGQIAVEIEVFGAGGVLFKECVAHPVIADFATSPMASHQAAKTFRTLRHEGAEVVTDRFLGFLASLAAGGAGLLGDDHQAAQVRQPAGEGFDGENFDAPLF